jgi:hypothetical protein
MGRKTERVKEGELWRGGIDYIIKGLLETKLFRLLRFPAAPSSARSSFGKTYVWERVKLQK